MISERVIYRSILKRFTLSIPTSTTKSLIVNAVGRGGALMLYGGAVLAGGTNEGDADGTDDAANAEGVLAEMLASIAEASASAVGAGVEATP
jgi:hypothetical protein